MAATPQYGTMVFRGLQTGKSYSVDIYVSDVDRGLINFDQGDGAGASSPTSWRAPENCILSDYAQVTGTADTEKVQITRNGRPVGDILRYSVHLTSLNSRPQLTIGIARGDDVAGIQISD